MAVTVRPSRLLFAAALIGLGIIGVVNGDFALAWQHIPVHHLPGRSAIAYACEAIELACGVGLLLRRARRLACRVLFSFLLLWVLLLEIPSLPGHWLNVDVWAGVAEITTILAGGWVLFAIYSGPWERHYLTFAVVRHGVEIARWVLIASLPALGLQLILRGATYHLPPWLAWLPSSVDWVYLSGIGSLAASLALLFGVWPRLAATLEAAMMGVITICFWGPWLQTGRTATTAFLISSLIAASIWIVADTYRGVRWLAIGHPAWDGEPALRPEEGA